VTGSGTARPVQRRYGREVDDLQSLRAANQRYYEAFEASDLDAMSALWERSDRALCTHPGWSTLRGWGHIASSFMALFQSPGALQFVLTEARPVIVGDAGWVSLDENLLGDDSGVTVAAINLFVRHNGGWRMVAHHGSVVQAAVGQMG
jgi:ketosteroid isomerase-like protein